MTVIFSDGFETNNYDAWTGTVITSGETIAASSIYAHHGTYSSKSTSNGNATVENAYFYYDADLAEVYVRAYVWIDSHNINAAGDQISIIRIRTGTTLLAHFGIRMTGGVVRWWMQVRNGTAYVDSYSGTPQTGQWYCVEGHWKLHASTGGGELFIDGTSVLSTWVRDTDNYGNLTRIAIGIAETSGTTTAVVYADCAVISDVYIGTESTDKTVVVTNEDLSVDSGFEYDAVTYTATVLDAAAAKLPASFVVNLRLDGTPVVANQALNSGVYSQATGVLTLVWYVPSGYGAETIDLQWSEQTI